MSINPKRSPREPDVNYRWADAQNNKKKYIWSATAAFHLQKKPNRAYWTIYDNFDRENQRMGSIRWRKTDKVPKFVPKVQHL